MKPLEFFSGTKEEVQKIKEGENAQAIFDSARYHPNQERKLQEQRQAGITTSRTLNFRRFGAPAVLIILGVTIGLGLHNRLLTATTTSVPTQEQVEQIQARLIGSSQKDYDLIQRVDQGMSKLYEIANLKTATLGLAQVESLLNPIVFYDQNRENPQRNGYQVALEDIKNRGPIAALPVNYPPAKDTYFYIDFLRTPNNEGEFNPYARVVEVPLDLDPNNLLDLSSVYHEIVHARQDTLLRRRLISLGKIDNYNNFYLAKRVTPVSLNYDEDEAYLKQIALIDLLTDGQLSRDVQVQNIDPAKYISLLHAKPSQSKRMETLILMAIQASKTDADYLKLNPEFNILMNNGLFQEGFDIYDTTADGRFVPVLTHPTPNKS